MDYLILTIWLVLGSNVLPIGRFLQMSHSMQALTVDDKSDMSKRSSVLSPLLPEAMIRYLDNYGPEEFSQVFLSWCVIYSSNYYCFMYVYTYHIIYVGHMYH